MKSLKKSFAILAVALLCMLAIPFVHGKHLIFAILFIVIFASALMLMAGAFMRQSEMVRGFIRKYKEDPSRQRRKLALIICVAVPLFTAFYFYLEYSARNLDLTRQAMQDIQISATGHALLGDEVKMKRWGSSFHIEETGNEGSADLVLPVYGSRGKADAHIDGIKSDGHWQITTLYLTTDNSSNEIPIAH
jgi:hypothetical protein